MQTQPFTRRRGFCFLLAFFASAMMLMAGHSTATGEQPKRIDSTAAKPNILFIFTDDHAYQSISAYGSKINVTPNIDRIAKAGIRFDRCYVPNSICGPCRAVPQWVWHA